MNSSFVKTVALISMLGGFAALAPAQAASRSVEISAHHFASRCNDLGGRLTDASPKMSCLIEHVSVSCRFVGANLAACDWPGIDSQLAVNRLIGLPQATTMSETSGAPAPGVKKIVNNPPQIENAKL